MMGGLCSSRLFAAGIALCVVAGCATVDYPSNRDLKSGPNRDPNALDLKSVEDARHYIRAVRDEMVHEQTKLKYFEATANVGVIGGGVAALTGGLLNYSRNFFIKSSLVAGTSLGLGTTVAPRTQSQVLDRGLDALGCVDDKAEAAYVAVRARDLALQPVRNRRDELARVLLDAAEFAAKFPESAGMSKEDFLKVLKEAQENLWKADLFIDTSGIPIERVVQSARLATDSVVRATNVQLSQVQPDAAAFSRMVQSIQVAPPAAKGDPVGPGKKDDKELDAALSKVQRLRTSSDLRVKSAATQVDLYLNDVKQVTDELFARMDALKDKLPPTATLEAPIITSCAVAGTVLKVTPSGPIIIKEKDVPYDLVITGGPFIWAWNGPSPSKGAVTIQTLSSMSLRITQSQDVDSAEKDKFALLLIAPGGDPLVLPLTLVATSPAVLARPVLPRGGLPLPPPYPAP